MITVAFIIMILVCFNFVLKQTYRKVYSVALSATVSALFTGLMWPYATEQSKTQIYGWLTDTTLMLDISVILTIEVAVQMIFCILAVHIGSSGKLGKNIIWLYRILRWFPGILVYPVLFSILTYTIFAMPGTSFKTISWALAIIVFIIIIFGSRLLKWLLPEKEIRLELLFLSNALIGILGIVGTVNGQTAVAGISEVDWLALSGVAALVVCGIAGGVLAYRIKLKRTLKNK